MHMGIEPYGRWAERAGERPHSTLLKPKFFVGNRTMDFSVEGRAKGSATQTTGISLDEVGLDLDVGFEQELLAFYLTDYVPGTQWVRCLDWFKKAGVDPNSIQRVTVYGELGGKLLLLSSRARPAERDRLFSRPPGAKKVIGFGAGAESRRPLGVAVVGGRLTSTFLTLVVVPVVYTLFADLADWGNARLGRSKAAPSEVPEPAVK